MKNNYLIKVLLIFFVFNIFVINYNFASEKEITINTKLNYVDNKYYIINKPYTDKKYLIDNKGQVLMYIESDTNIKRNIYITTAEQNKYYFCKEEYNEELDEQTTTLYDEQLNIVDVKEDNNLHSVFEEDLYYDDYLYSYDDEYFNDLEKEKINYNEKSNFVLKNSEIFENTNLIKSKCDKAYDMSVDIIKYENYTEYINNKNEILAIDYNNVEESDLYFFENKYIVVVSEKSIYFFEKNDNKKNIEPYVIYAKNNLIHNKDIHYIIYADLTKRINVSYSTVDIKFLKVPTIEYDFKNDKYLFIIKNTDENGKEGVYNIKGNKYYDFKIYNGSGTFIIQIIGNENILYDKNFNYIIKQKNIVDIIAITKGIKAYIVHTKINNKSYYKLISEDGIILLDNIKILNDEFEFLTNYYDYTDIIQMSEYTNKTYYQFLDNMYIIFAKNNCSAIHYDNVKNKKKLNKYDFIWKYHNTKYLIYFNKNKFGLLDENLNVKYEINE